MKKLLLLFFSCSLLIVSKAAPASVTEFIKIDQFGYRPGDQKIAVISDPQTGYNSAQAFTPGTTYQIRDWNTDAVVFNGSPVTWNNGNTHTQSGDKVSWFDFSSFSNPGSFYVYDVQNNVGSYRFEIAECVYNDVMKTAMRVFYYQRAGFAKSLPYADPGYTDGASHLGPEQDTDCRLYSNTNVSTSKDLSGGWFDAGDYNKYVNFTWGPMLDLLHAYSANPLIWTTDYNIPESGATAFPDIINEVMVELNWLRKMQNADGSVLSVVGGGSASPPSSDNNPRRYGPATTSATLTCAGIFAFAAVQFENMGELEYSDTFRLAALDAWSWAGSHPSVTFYNAGLVASGEQEVDTYGTLMRKIGAAVYLYDLTGSAQYKSFVEQNYMQVHMMAWGFAYPFEGTEQDMLLHFSQLSGVTQSVKDEILGVFTSSMSNDNEDNLPSFQDQTDAYRAYLKDDNYTWGSNQTKAEQAIMFMNMNRYGLDVPNQTDYENATSGFLHYFHGVNPNSKTFLSNMSAYGAENSVTSFYHAWFADQSPLWDEVGVSTYGPAPGYVPGGVNPNYDWDACCPSGCGDAANNAQCVSESIDPPKNQPIQKSWKDFNTSWPLNSWTVTEPAIYTQAAYVRMLSAFVSPPCELDLQTHTSNSGLIQTVFPQPSDDKLFVQLIGNHSQVKCVLLDVNGRVVFTEEFSVTGNNAVEIDLSATYSGMYFLQVSDGPNMEIRKIIVE